MTGTFYTRAAKLAGLEQIARQCGGDLSAQMRKAGLDPVVRNSPEEVIGYTEFCALLEGCAKDWDMPDIGLQMIRYQQIDFLGPVALVTRMERTVRNAIQAIIANLVIHSNVTMASLEEEDGTATLILNQREGAPQLAENAQLVLAQGKVVIDAILMKSVPLVQITMIQSKGCAADAIARHFACPVIYNAERNSFSFDASLLEHKIERTDKAYHALIKRYLDTARDEVAANTIESVRIEIARQMELGHCTLQSVAMAQKMEPHTLQRRLRADDASFRELVEEWRRNRALSLVTNTRLPLSDVSDALGYSERSIFSQAFRRWFGEAPQQYRIAAGA